VKAELNIGIKDPGRELEVLDKVADASSDPAVSAAIRDVYETVFDCSRQIQRSNARKKNVEPIYFPQVTIVGMGLIGGVIARLIRENVPQTKVIGVDVNAGPLHEALALGLIDRAEADLKKSVIRSSLVIVAASPDANLRLLEELAPVLKKRQLVVDVTSAKSTIVEAADKLKCSADFVGGHPLFGSERSGPTASTGVKAAEAVFCLTPCKKSSDMSLRRLIRWLGVLGLKTAVIDAPIHDHIIASTSHAVQLLTVALGMKLSDLADEVGMDQVLSLCGPGVKQLARLMNSPADLWSQIAWQNKDEIALALQELIRTLNTINDAVLSDDKAALSDAFKKARRIGVALQQKQ
jgi:prephenate dehydrogenase